MTISRIFTTVTPLSKILALYFFVSLPFVGFLAGLRYQRLMTPERVVYVDRPVPISPVFTPTPQQPTAALLSPTTIPLAVAKTLKYSLPSGWATLTDPTSVLEVGYDPALADLISLDPRNRVRFPFPPNGYPIPSVGLVVLLAPC